MSIHLSLSAAIGHVDARIAAGHWACLRALCLVLSLVLASAFASLTAHAPPAPADVQGPDGLSQGSTVSGDPVTRLVHDLREHMAGYGGPDAQPAPLHPDPAVGQLLAQVDDGQGYELQPRAFIPLPLPAARGVHPPLPADAFTSVHPRRSERPPKQLA